MVEMIELTQGRSVKWQHGGAWFVGHVLVCGQRESLMDDDTRLVRHSDTSKVFVVYASDLQNNTCRADERAAEAAKAVINRLDECIERLSALAGGSLDAGVFLDTAKDYSREYHAGRLGIDAVSGLVDGIETVFGKGFSSSKEAEAAQ